MKVEDYKAVLEACNNTIMLAKETSKLHTDTPIIQSYCLKMIFNASSARAAVIEKAKKEYPIYNWLNEAIGEVSPLSNVDSNTGKSTLREAKIRELVPVSPNRAGDGMPPSAGN